MLSHALTKVLDRQAILTHSYFQEVVQLSMFLLPAQESLHRVLDLLIELLIRGGADPNAIGSKYDFLAMTVFANSDSAHRMGYESLFKGSPLGLLAKYLRTCYFSARCISQLRLDRILIKYGCDVSDLTSPILHHPGSAGLFLHQPALLLGKHPIWILQSHIFL